MRKLHITFTYSISDMQGPYIVEWEHYDICRGPKVVNLTVFTTTLTKQENDMYRGTLNITFLDQTKIEEVNVFVLIHKIYFKYAYICVIFFLYIKRQNCGSV